MTPVAASAARPQVVLFCAAGTLEGVDPRLRLAGVPVDRVVSVELRPVAPTRWLPSLLGHPPPDTVVVTSRAAVTAGVRPWRRAGGRRLEAVEYWAVGSATARALRRDGVRRIRRPRKEESAAIRTAFRRGPSQRILYFRSDRAGPGLARSLRADGHRVIDRVVYRTGPARPLGARAVRGLTGVKLLVVTSPSGLDELRRRLVRRTWTTVTRGTLLVVLGDRSRRAARELGFHRVSVVRPTTPQRFTQRLLRVLRDAPA